MLQYLVILGFAVNMWGTSIYIRDIFRNKTTPNLVTWILWAAAPIIASAAAFANGVRWAVLPTFSTGLGPLIVVIVALFIHKAIWRPTYFDYICGILSVAALILWLLTKQPNIAIIFAIASDGLAGLPTLRKIWHFPHTESGITYTTALFGMFTTIPALKTFAFAEIAFPIYNICMNSALSFSAYRKKILDSLTVKK